MRLVVFIFSFYLFFIVSKCAKILGVFPAPGYSQFILCEILMTELANRGHQVTVISPYSPKTEIPNYRTIKTSDVIENTLDFNLFDLDRENLFINILTTYHFGNSITEYTMKNKEVQELLHSKETFDLVIVEQFFNDAMKAFAHHFQAPLVLFCSMGSNEWSKHWMGSPVLPSISPVTYTSYTDDMSFFQRSRNLVGTIFDYFYRNFIVYPQQKEYLQKYFPNPPDFDGVLYNASLMLLNSHVTTTGNALLPYNMIEIGGFHVVQNPLDKDLQNYLDDAEAGAILFSLGSNLRSADLSPDVINGIFNVFGKLKQRILWKFEKHVPNKPNNVLISKWLNQRDILAHPNIQLFITHGGLLSTTEAVFYGVPMVGIPIFADQKMNMARASKEGIAKVIPFSELSEKNLFEAINETLNNRYRENARKMSNLIRDRIVRPLDVAMYWIEYVIRHKGIRFEPPTLKLYWFQVYMIDIAVFVLSILLIFYIICKFILINLRKAAFDNVGRKIKIRKNKAKQR